MMVCASVSSFGPIDTRSSRCPANLPYPFASSDVRIRPAPHPPPIALDLRRLAWALALAPFVAGGAAADEAPLRVAVYDAPPYGHLEADGSISGLSVELWRRTAELLGREYRLIPVGEMKAIIEGVARNDYDAAIGAITPERLAKVDFSYPAHRSGIAVAVRKESGPLAAFAAYAAVVAHPPPNRARPSAARAGARLGDVCRRRRRGRRGARSGSLSTTRRPTVTSRPTGRSAGSASNCGGARRRCSAANIV